jgi:heme oxygenase
VTPPHTALRAATAAAHESLHHLPIFAALGEGRLDRAGYRGLLGRLLGFHAPIEAAVAACIDAATERDGGAFGLDLIRLRRAPLLLDDLAALGVAEAAIGALPRLPAPVFATPAQAMGALYVLEGATLGGRALASGLDPVVGRGTLPGRRFLLAGTDPARPAWREVRAALDRCGADQAALAAMIQSALTTFDAFGAWFAQRPGSLAGTCG